MERLIEKIRKARTDPAFDLARPPGRVGPLVFSSPHSGRAYSRRFRKLSRLDTKTLRLSEDCYVDQLFRAAPDFGAPLISARTPRAYVDVNREPLELDPAMFTDSLPDGTNSTSERVAVGLGTIARIVSVGLDIYDRKLVYAQEEHRIQDIYVPYHRALSGLLEKARAIHGWAALIDCHSMPSCGATSSASSGATSGPTSGPGGIDRIGAYRPPATSSEKEQSPYDPDIVLGDRFGTSCSAALADRIEASFTRMGYRVVRNDPYAGGYCTVRYGAPIDGIHAIQIEINRRLYMCERSLRKRRGDFERVQGHLGNMIADLTGLDLGREQPLAAE